MSDAAIVTVENGKGVFRASALGQCERALIAARMGMTPAAPPQWLQAKFDEGHELEQMILDRASDRLGVRIVASQHPVEVPVGEFALIRGHIDGKVRVDGAGLEAKALGPDLTKEWLRGPRHFFSSHPVYRDQLTVYMAGTNWLPFWYAVWDKENEDLHLELVEEPPGDIDEIVARVLQIELAGRKGQLPKECIAPSFPCFEAGTLVLTKDGYTPIEGIAPGDEVLSHKGRWCRVSENQANGPKPIRRVSGYGVPGLCTTDEHPFYSRERFYQKHGKAKNNNVRVHRKLTYPEWVMASDLTRSHFMGHVLPPVVPNSRIPEFWKLVGRYLADGYLIHSTKSVVITCSYGEVEDVCTLVKEAGYDHLEPEYGETAAKVRVRNGVSSGLFHSLSEYGHMAHGKRLTLEALTLDSERAEALLQGYLDGDGHEERGPERNDGTCSRFWIVSSVSKELLLGFALVAHRARGVVASVRPAGSGGEAMIEGRTVHERPSWMARIPEQGRTAYQNAHADDRYAWKQVYGSEDMGYSAPVYNLRVEQDESFIAEGAIVHNCPFYYLPGHDSKAAKPDDTDEFAVLAQEAVEAREDKKRAEERAKSANAQLLEYLQQQDADKLECEGYTANRVASKSVNPDRDAMKEDGIYDKYMVVTEFEYAKAQRKEE